MKFLQTLSVARRTIFLSLGFMLVLSVVRLITNADDITSSATILSLIHI
jgi:hypothetical protein